MWCSQRFDREGYHSCVLAPSLKEVKTKLTDSKAKGIIFCTLPYECAYKEATKMLDVSLSSEWKAELATLDKGKEDESE